MPVDFPAAHAVAYDKHRVRVSVVRASTAIFSHSPAKLRHRQDQHVVHSLAQVLVKRGDAGAQLLQKVCQLPAGVSLVRMRVPPSVAHVSKSNFQTHTRFDELCDL